MNEQLQAELMKVIGNINSGAETAWSFITSQTPEIVQQLMIWHGAKSLLWFVLSLGLLILTITVGVKLFKWAKNYTETNKRNYGDCEMIFMIPAVATIAGIALSLTSFSIEWLQIWIAPKVWLLEYVAKMVK